MPHLVSTRRTLGNKFARWLSLLAWLLVAEKSAAWQMKQAPLMTQWAALVDTNNPLPEYPRPQLVRSNWLNLNGIWQFQPGATNDPVPTNQTLSGNILVPYPMESAISGVMKYSQFSWYRQLFTVPAAWSGKHVILHFDAVNWQSRLYINGQSVGIHKGAYDPFSYDITPYLIGSGAQELVMQVYSPVDNGGQPRGKQTLYPGGIMYTSSSGIWQPVWLEPVDASGVQSLVIIPDIDNAQLRLTVNTYATNGVTVAVSVSSNGLPINFLSGNPAGELDIRIPNAKLWSPSSPFLYDLQIAIVQGGVTNDFVTSYFGMRKISLSTVNGVPEILLNNQQIFQMGPLDQGFWPDGLYTAPTEAAQNFDLLTEKALGFNMVRKHIKTERLRWYYWTDKLGLLVWQDMPSCNSYSGASSLPAVDPAQFITELTRLVTNHWNNPSVIMWDVFNEGQGQENTSGGVGQSSTATLVNIVKTLDLSRLVNQASGGSYYGVGDIYDEHAYPAPGNPVNTNKAPVDGEYGGIGYQLAGHLWNPALAAGDYTGANTLADIAPIYDSFITDILTYKAGSGLNAAVYTQITDVENECNGLMTYDRVMKPDALKITISNQKAISGKISSTTILPASQTSGANWNYVTNYTTNSIPANWFATNYSDSAWASGSAGFGAGGPPGAVIRTAWNTADIWLRRQVALGSLPGSGLSNLVFNCYHDEDCELYINGSFAGSATGYTTEYVSIPINAAGQAALLANATNLIAVHCHQTTGGQFIDVGIATQTITANSLTVPVDANGYWALNETSGTNAFDSSGSGNTGKVSGATWNTNGEIGGSLMFNGVNSSVQVGRAISNDFTISFWIKTTQTGGVGEWYNGKGLVDGYVSANVNDFGTALVGGKFGFGVGNPDTTILSASSINDGQWHHCVATRAQNSGALNVYVDGNLEKSGIGGTNSLAASASLLFGALASGGGYFNGALDEIKTFNRALGNYEVAALYASMASNCPAPTNLTLLPGNGRVSLSWNSSLAAASYNVSRATSVGGPYVLVGNTAATTFVDTTVTNGITYYYIVNAVNAFGAGANSTSVSVMPYNLTTWLRADAITGVASGSAVSFWPDVSGVLDNAVQTNAANQPTFVTGAMNSLPVVRFNAGASNYLSFNRPVQDDFTLFCVFQSTQGSGTGTYYYSGAGIVSGEVAGAQNDLGTCLFANGSLSGGTGNPDVTIHSGNGYNDGHPHVLTLKRTMISGLVQFYVDGVLIGSTTGGTQSLTSPSQLVLGAQQTLINFFSGDISEVKIYNSALSDTDRAGQESALECKYGFGAVTPPPTPTNLQAVAGNRVINLSWPPSSGASSYSLYRSTNNGSTYYPAGSGITSASFTDTNAVSGITNYYLVYAVTPCRTSNPSLAAAVLLPLPVLNVQASTGGLSVNWPGIASDWNLWSATNLIPPVTWIRVTNTAILSNYQYTVKLPYGVVNQFFRLASP